MTNEDGMLSQAEIDALLDIGSGEDDDDHSTDVKHEESEITSNLAQLSSIEIDTLGEVGNISFGSSATTLSTLLNNKVEITTPVVTVIEKKDLKDALNFQPVSVQVDYIDGFIGQNVFVIKANDAAIIADIMLGGDGSTPDEELNDLHLSAVQEAMNQMMGTAATSMSTIFQKKVDISPPSIIEEDSDIESIFEDDFYVKIFFKLTVGDLIDSNMMQLMPITFAKQLVGQLLNGSSEADRVEEEIAPMVTFGEIEKEEEQPLSIKNQSIEVNHQETKQPHPQYIGNNVNGQAQVQEASFSNFEKVELNSQEKRNLDMLLDIPLNITVELGRTKKPIRDILDFTSGSIIELDKLAGEPVDILVNNKLIAEGEVVVIEENFGVRVTDIISKTDRIMKLK
ncbi:flagellar motor switch phosphatase FliY [Oceanobacillus piezotolerans]|uniref:Flagellar motor switch phosphatase FliY n=1 Tax=Oceanobacillus piezotolerans TaxID=2448030 RepID=A0A498D7A6_9BACI|nr:flagellar motor switch phosphatase FliY [Oceanobacillus piezotolerans]RLL45326.1 flagellar motor switch phosphatase FliY [Oceanobacillus piezotolerans]